MHGLCASLTGQGQERVFFQTHAAPCTHSTCCMCILWPVSFSGYQRCAPNSLPVAKRFRKCASGCMLLLIRLFCDQVLGWQNFSYMPGSTYMPSNSLSCVSCHMALCTLLECILTTAPSSIGLKSSLKWLRPAPLEQRIGLAWLLFQVDLST